MLASFSRILCFFAFLPKAIRHRDSDGAAADARFECHRSVVQRAR